MIKALICIMKSKILIILLLLTGTLAFSQNTILKGKKFKTAVTQSCAKTTTGGYMKYSYTQYEFGKDSVAMVFYFKRSDMPKEETHTQTYKYKVSKQVVLVMRQDKGVKSVDTLKFVSRGLVGKRYGNPIALAPVQ